MTTLVHVFGFTEHNILLNKIYITIAVRSVPPPALPVPNICVFFHKSVYSKKLLVYTIYNNHII